ncbi:unnamed protein product [Ilex paraguariensis]|uniref:DUF4378 domain-containing protein n=1 Tax=Ilex paraguariensis TaxID=185542 RepID=A0ABC8RSJ6_9AQUA
MAAKLLQSLTDDHPDLQKQIGCMTGIFQLFDRHQIVTGRHIAGYNPKRFPPGSSHFNNANLDTESNYLYRRSAGLEKHTNKNVQERHRVSTESSRASFSSSSRSSSFSSLDCNKTTQPEPSSFDRIIFPETPSRDPVMGQSSRSPQFGRQTLDLRDVVRDAMYRDVQGLCVKTTTKEKATDRVVKQRDSPRPPQLTKSNDKSHKLGLNGKQNMPADLKESVRVLAKLREAPWYFNEAKGLSRSSSYGSKDGSLFSVPKDAPRFSYDGRESNCSSFESRDGYKSTLKLKELPRLSLDSRQNSMRSCNSESKSSFLSRNSEEGNSSGKVPSSQQTSGTQARPPSVVAKLMGLAALPESASTTDSKIGSTKTCPLEHSDHYPMSSKTSDPCRPIQISASSKNLWKEPTSPRWKNPDSVLKPMSRFPIEPAPWRQLDGTRGPPKPASRHLKAPARAPNPFPSVYSEIENRLKDLEFTQSGKDLRALKQILEAMQAKGLLDTRKGGQDSNFSTQKDHDLKYTSPFQNAVSISQRRPQSDNAFTFTKRGPNSLRAFESPIVIMKPAKLAEKSGTHASSAIPLEGSSSIPRLQSGDVNDRKVSTNSRMSKGETPKNSRRVHTFNSIDIKTSSRPVKSAQTSTRPQPLPKERATGSIKSSGSISPRMQQKKLDLERQSRPPTPPSDSNKSRRQTNRQQHESSSGRSRPKSSNFQQSDGQLSEICNEMRNVNYQDHDITLLSDGNIVPDLKVEVTSFNRSAEINGSQSPSTKAVEYSIPCMVQKKPTPMLGDESLLYLTTVGPDYPSPVSVLDNPVCIDDALSPLKEPQMPPKDNGTQNSDDQSTKEQLKPSDGLIFDTLGSSLTSEISRKKLQNIEHLVQKLRRLNSSHDEARTDYIASLCENTDPDHRYISEILLASGLLLRDLGSDLTNVQFHRSGHPINPELFLVLEQTKASTLPKKEYVTEKEVQSKPDDERIHRKIIFDAVNEILVRKLALVGPPDPLLSPGKLARKNPNAKKLLRELCLEIEQLQAKKTERSLEEEDDSLKSILWEDVMLRSESWTDVHGEISWLVLDVERSIFKDLVDEIVIGGAAGSRAKPSKQCRQLFTK